MNWHEPSRDEIKGVGDHRFVVDIIPDVVPYQVARDGDALIMLSRPGWSWLIRDAEKKKNMLVVVGSGLAETREAAVGDALAKLGELRS